MSNISYFVGDMIYVEERPTSPFGIRKIVDIVKSKSGWVEAKVQLFYRRSQLPNNSLLSIADKKLRSLEETCRKNGEALTDIEWHRLKHHEVFITHSYDYVQIRSIRGKCSVNYFCELESLLEYINKEDLFFYRLVYDPGQKNLLLPNKETRVGIRYQAEIPQLRTERDMPQSDDEQMETLLWSPDNKLTDSEMQKYVTVVEAIGTMARTMDTSYAPPERTMIVDAPRTSRDVTRSYALDVLFSKAFNVMEAIFSLVPSSGPVVPRDQLEVWPQSEVQYFEDALRHYGKNFKEIREDVLPWKSLKSIVEYYYFWKTTSRYSNNNKPECSEKQSKTIILPIGVEGRNDSCSNTSDGVTWREQDDWRLNICASCASGFYGRYFVWGRKENKMCASCWMYWKKYGGLKVPSDTCLPDADCLQKSYRCIFVHCLRNFDTKLQLARHYASNHRMELKHYMPKTGTTVRKLPPFYLRTTLFNRISRRLCQRVVRPKKIARNPFKYINMNMVKQECAHQMTKKAVAEILQYFSSNHKSVNTHPLSMLFRLSPK